MDADVLVVGAGFAGIGLAIRLKQAGVKRVIVLEGADEVGGTWRDNRYPGAACDVQSHLYCFSFEPNPEWSREFAPQEEILSYLRRTTDKYGIRDEIHFGTTVENARFDERSAEWVVATNRRTYRARFLVVATGGLSRPALPHLKDQERFSGHTFHTARWDAGCSLEGKSVAVIGTGASAIQIVPEVAREASRLVVFQRTAPWVLPKPDAAIPTDRRRRFRKFPFLQRLARLALYWKLESRVYVFAKRPHLIRHGERMALDYLERTVSDPELRRKLRPSFTMGCKRVLMSNDYYQTLEKPHVDLVTEPIDRLVPEGIVTASGALHAVDVIVYATGFQVGDAGAPFSIIGARGVDLDELWKQRPRAYLGATAPGFPNLFFLSGPNTGLSHTSVVFMLESVMNYVVDAVVTMNRRGLCRFELREDVCDRYNEALQARFEDTVWSSGCKSWYLTKDGTNVAIWPGTTFEFRRRTSRFDPESYEFSESPQSAGEGHPNASVTVPRTSALRPQTQAQAEDARAVIRTQSTAP